MPQTSRVLLVDDREAVRESIQLFLYGFDCDFAEAGTGAAALRLLRGGTFDVTFLAVKLTDMDGLQFLRQIREENLAAGKVIVVTSLPDPKKEAEAKGELDAFRYIEKPLSIEQVRTIFEEATSTSAAPLPPPAPPSVPTSDPGPPTPIAATPQLRVLVLDDNPDRLDQIRESLEPHFDLIPLMDDDEACTWANQEKIDIAVIYHKLARGITGLDVVARMRMAHPKRRAIILIEHPDYKPRLDPKSALAYAWRRDLPLLPEMIRQFLSQPIGSKKVFLSYAQEDREQVFGIFTALTSHGYLPWIDRKSITPGYEWKLEIPAAIDVADFFVFCLSRHSAVKTGTLFDELKYALIKQRATPGLRFIIPALLENVTIDQPLNAYQAIPFFEGGISALLDALSVTDAQSAAHTSAADEPPQPLGLTQKTLAELIAGGENDEVEFKSTVRWDLHQKKASKELEAVIVKAVAAFLNSYRGGTLLIGVDDDGVVIGLELDYQTLKKKNRDGFQAFLQDLLLPKYGYEVAPYLHTTFEVADGKDVCRVGVSPSSKQIYVDGRMYIRTGNATKELTTREAIEYSKERWR